MAQNETKLASYYNTPFTRVCLGMTRNGVTNWIVVSHTASSLYRVIADGDYSATNLGSAEWKSLINGASLQTNCNREGFNVRCSNLQKSRIGIAGDNQKNCNSCNSGIGFGITRKHFKWSSGNIYYRSNIMHKKMQSFGFIFVQ